VEQAAPAFLTVSRILDVPVRGRAGEWIGRLRDVVARVQEPGDDRFPPLSGLVVNLAGRRGHPVFVTWESVGTLEADGISLSSSRLDFRPFARRDGELLVMHDVVDKQVVDVEGRRVVRVNDVMLAPDPTASGGWRVAAADVGWGAFVGRVVPRMFQDAISRRAAHSASVIPWEQVEFFASDVPDVKLRVTHSRLARLHPADIAELIAELGYRQSEEMVASLDDETAADVVENLPEELQSALMTTLEDERAADILDEMEPDVAADILASLPHEDAQDLLRAMEPDEAADVTELLEYRADTAGGVMTNDYVSLPTGITAGEAIGRLRRSDSLPDLLNYVYLVEPESEVEGDPVEAEGRLAGVVTLKNLLLAAADAPIASLADEEDVVSVNAAESAEEAAERLAHYGVLALPVVDDAGRLLGIITVDDALERLVPEDLRSRLPRLFR
jgi:magnesium transporter